MSWIILFLAGLFEIAWAIGLKYSEGFTKLTPSIITIITMFISFYLLSLALKSLPLGTAYAIWVGIGLSIVKNICDKNGIKIELDSKENQGSTFTYIFSL